MDKPSLRVEYFAGSILFLQAVNQGYSPENGQER